MSMTEHGAAREIQPWREAEDEIIKTYYLSEREGIVKRLSGRSAAACHVRAVSLGLIVPDTLDV